MSDGEVYKAENTNINLLCGDMAVFFVTDKEIPCVSEKTEYTLKIKNFKPVSCSRFKLTDCGLKKEEFDIKLIDNDFSGEVTYLANLILPQKPNIDDRFKITLENTSVSASIVINGIQVATVGLKPMNAIIKGEYLKKENSIEIIVSNTAANEIIAYHSVIDAFPKAEIGSYDVKCIEFEKRRYSVSLGNVSIEKML